MPIFLPKYCRASHIGDAPKVVGVAPECRPLALLLLLLLLCGWLVGTYKQRLRPSKQATRAYFGICLVFLKGVHGVFHRFEKEFWCRLLASFFS